MDEKKAKQMMNPCISEKVKVGSIEMYYEITGLETGPWVVLIHGISGTTRCWKYQLDSFNQHFRILNFDLIGHGNSTSLETEKYNGPIIANYIRMLMDKLHIDKAHFVGLSLGTIVQQYFCQLFPERVLSMVFTSPVTKSNYLSKIFNAFADKIYLKLFSKDAYFKLMGNMMLPGKINEKSRHFFVQETKKMKKKEFLKWWNFSIKDDHFYYLSKSDIPCLVIVGSKDFCFHNDSIELCKKFPNNTYVELKDVGHVLIFQKAKEYNAIVVDYITGLEKENAS